MRDSAFGAIITVSLAGLLGLVAGCGGQASSVCSLICDCEHCNDYEEDLTCIQVETSLSVAEAYDCAQEWEDYASCVEEKGKCDEKEADFSTRADGSCSATQPIGFPCMVQADCDQVQTGLTCTGGECAQRVCAGDPYPCDTNADCPGGPDRCEDEAVDLGECESKASDRDVPISQPSPG